MSFLSFEKTAVHDVEKFFSIFSKTSTEQKIVAAAGALAPIVEEGLALNGDTADAQLVAKAFTTVQTDLGTFVAIVQTRSLRPVGPKKPRARGKPEPDHRRFSLCAAGRVSAAVPRLPGSALRFRVRNPVRSCRQPVHPPVTLSVSQAGFPEGRVLLRLRDIREAGKCVFPP